MPIVLTEEEIQRSLKRMAHEILEKNSEPFLLLGIPTRGVDLANRLQVLLSAIGTDVEVGQVDVSMHRDDLDIRGAKPLSGTRLPTSLESKTVILVDDVLFSGRTIRAAMDALSDFGRPARIQLAVLIDRGHRELPIRADYVGKNIPTAKDEKVSVRLFEIDGATEVVVDK